jgi:hypothetical protein
VPIQPGPSGRNGSRSIIAGIFMKAEAMPDKPLKPSSEDLSARSTSTTAQGRESPKKGDCPITPSKRMFHSIDQPLI